jgi:NAD(P)-dependent dehydrogenase (short-subunit alcohol dehydrogenase family)
MKRGGEMETEQLRRAFEVNVFSQYELVRLALPHLAANGGRVVFLSTGLAEMPFAGWSSYCSYCQLYFLGG